ncbi:putative acyl-CoA dehydrogenase [uncultured Desulfobacterium sp.]|uniref:Putative acyl-CoA dehydrogenase n=1 Tax=uncultured Desulfobacterium sp. TaxID=201089 RepID=A0A445MTK4_9BACT|nr:putative acyl-CoA dehydrogenase [uncultured Desulfobacterium sp.]
MDFSLSAEQKDIIKAAREFAQGEFPDVARDFDRDETFDENIWKEACELGFVGIFVPERYDGAEYGFFEHCLVTEEFWAVEPGIGQAILSTTLGAEIISLFGSDEQKRLVLPRLVAGKEAVGVAIAEPGGDWDVAAAKTTAIKDGENWLINGSKTFVPNGASARFVLVYCDLLPDRVQGDGRYGFILVPTDSEGYSAEKIHGKMGLRAAHTSTVNFNGVRVPLKNLVGKEGEGVRQLGSYLDRLRLTMCAQAVGLSRAALKEMIQHTAGRHIFGVPLNSFQVTQFKIANMAVRIKAAKNLYYEAAWGMDQGRTDSNLIAMAKQFCAETAVYCADEALQAHGGYGYIDEYKVQRLYRDAKALDIMEGAKEMELISGVMDLGVA